MKLNKPHLERQGKMAQSNFAADGAFPDKPNKYNIICVAQGGLAA